MKSAGRYLLCLFFIFVLFTACGQDPKQGQPGGEAPAVISVWYSLEGKLEQELLNQFEQINEKQHEFLVKGVKIPAKEFVHKVWGLQAGGQGPEIFIANRDIIATLYEQGALSPVLADSSPVFPSLLAEFTYNRQAFALPWLTDVPLLYYRKDAISTPPVDFNGLWSSKQPIAVKAQDFLLFSPWWKAEGGILSRGDLPALDAEVNSDFLGKLLASKSDGKIIVDEQAIELFSTGQVNYLLGWASDSIDLDRKQVDWACVSFSRLQENQAQALLAKTIGIANSSIKTGSELENAIRLVEEELLETEAGAAAQKATGYMPANMNFYDRSPVGTLTKEAATTIENCWSIEGSALEWKLLPLYKGAWLNMARQADISIELAKAQEAALQIEK
jgi:multiple sugar transport system substrate-binding protein